MPPILRQSTRVDDFLSATSLDHLETSSQSEDTPVRVPAASPQDAGVIFRHSGWRRYRDRIAAAFVDLELPSARQARYAACGEGAWVWQSPDDPSVYRLTGCYCHDRWCLPCGAARGRTIARNALEHVNGRKLRFLTLTLRQSDAPLRSHIDRLTASFAKLRRSRFWRDHVSGGMSILEVKHGTRHGRWNAHLHVLIEGKYLPHPVLKAKWHAITGDSFVIDIRAVKSSEDATRYVTKYVSKPLDHSVFASDATLTEAIEAMRGKRTLTTFGAWSGLDLTSEGTDAEWVSIGPLSELQSEARDGSESAKLILLSLHRETYATNGDDP